MNTIENDRELRKLMKEIGLEKPGAGFSTRVMDAIIAESAKKSVYRNEPVLSRNFWIFVGLFVGLAIVLILLGTSGASSSAEINQGIIERFPAPDLSEVKGGITKFMETISGLPITIAAIMIGTTILILADKFLSSKEKFRFG